MKVLITGGLHFEDSDFLEQYLNSINKSSAGPITHIITGYSFGAEYLTSRWAKKNKIKHSLYVNYNNDLFEYESDIELCIVFPYLKRSKCMEAVAHSKSNGIPILKVPYTNADSKSYEIKQRKNA